MLCWSEDVWSTHTAVPAPGKLSIQYVYSTHSTIIALIVNNLCRQVVEKHHFLTPDTPVLDRMELPSHMLRDSTTTTTTSSCHSRPISRLDGPSTTPFTTQPVPSCNLDTVSMEMTCSTATAPSGTKTKSINDKLNFLKQTLTHELSRMSSKNHSDSQSTGTAPPLATDTAQTTEQDTLREVREKEAKTEIPLTSKEGEEREREGKEAERRENWEEMGQDEAESDEIESVHLMSCESSRDKSTNSVDTGKREKPTQTEGDIGNDSRGSEGRGGVSSESEIEVLRAADGDPESFFSPETGVQPIHISPGELDFSHDVQCAASQLNNKIIFTVTKDTMGT